MLACRVCLAGGFSDDPEAWLDQCTPRQLSVWQAFYSIEPFGGEFHRTAQTNVMLSNVLSMIAAGHGQKVQPSRLEDFMPSNWIGSKPKKLAVKQNAKSVRKAEKILSTSMPTWKQRRMN
jgi:hypothetical protein